MLVTLPLHVLRELGKALGLAIAIFGFVLLAIAAGQMMRDGASIFTVFSVLPYLVPLVSPMVLPLTIITGTLICYGRLSATNEFSAAQAGGVHPLWIATPGLAVATLATCVTVFLNADVLDMATVRIEKAILSDMAGILQRKLSKPGSILFYDRVICRMRGKGGHAGIDVTRFSRKGKDDKQTESKKWDPAYPYPVERIIARDHEIKLDREADGDLYVRVHLKHFHAYDLSDEKIQPFIADTGNPRWPAARDVDINISPQRLTYMGFLTLSRMRAELLARIRMLCASFLIRPDIANWQDFCRQLRHEEGVQGRGPAWNLWVGLDNQDCEAVERAARGAALSPDNQVRLLAGLNEKLRKSALFQAGDFDETRLPEEARALLREREETGLASSAHQVRLNRLLLEAAFGEALRGSADRERAGADDLEQLRTRPEIPKGTQEFLGGQLKSLHKRTAEIHLKLALSFACLCFALVAVPLGLLTRRQNASTAFIFGIAI